jgi:Cofilin/tropomyosin-type actin-binding protein
MVYASSKDALRKALDGVALEIQGTDSSEVSLEAGVLLVPDLASSNVFSGSSNQSEVVLPQTSREGFANVLIVYIALIPSFS